MWPDLGPLHVAWKLIDWTSKVLFFPVAQAPEGTLKLLTQSLGIPNPKGDPCHLGQIPMSIDIFQYFLLMQGAHLLALTRILKSHPFPIEMLQEKEYFCPDPQLDFSGKCDSFRTLGCMTNDSHQEQMGAGFSSL
jgi:hypothetical protein